MKEVATINGNYPTHEKLKPSFAHIRLKFDLVVAESRSQHVT